MALAVRVGVRGEASYAPARGVRERGQGAGRGAGGVVVSAPRQRGVEGGWDGGLEDGVRVEARLGVAHAFASLLLLVSVILVAIVFVVGMALGSGVLEAAPVGEGEG